MSKQPRKANGEFAPTTGSSVALKSGPGGVLTVGTRAGDKVYMRDQAGKTVVKKVGELRAATPGDFTAFKPAPKIAPPSFSRPSTLKTGVPGRSNGKVSWIPK